MNNKISDNQDQKDGKPRKKIRKGVRKRVVAGVKLLKEEKRIIKKKEIMSILPHRKGKLFLDRVTITAKKIIGEFLVTSKSCEGHKIGGQPLFRGVDYPEMTAQLLGVWLSQQVDQYSNLDGKLAFLRKASFKSINFSIPGDLLRIEISVRERNEEADEEGNPRIETIGSEDRPKRSRQQAIGLNAEAWVNDKKKAVIYFIELGIVDAKGLAE